MIPQLFCWQDESDHSGDDSWNDSAEEESFTKKGERFWSGKTTLIFMDLQ